MEKFRTAGAWLLRCLLPVFACAILSPALAGESGGERLTADALPPQARETLRMIDRGGPFPYPRDGAVFNNFERRLPLQPRGYYREYTVPTPGLRNRGARRIISGGDPPTVFYYTDDHYRSFREIQR